MGGAYVTSIGYSGVLKQQRKLGSWRTVNKGQTNQMMHARWREHILESLVATPGPGLLS